jgi:spore germination protein YaaH
MMIVLSISLCVPVLSYAKTKAKVKAKPSLERLLYYTDTDTGYASLKAHASQIDILSPQAYTFDANGVFSGGVSDRAMQIIKKHPKIKLMPLIENAGFSMDIAHTLLSNPTLQDTFINTLVAVGKQNGYWGWQIDIEHMDAGDRALFTSFIQKTYTALHAQGFEFSVAVVAKVSDNPADFSAASWDGWAGAFDYAPLAQSSDFLSVMLYDQDNSVGPASTLTWYSQVVAYATSIVPANKLSIGIPFYAWEWVPGDDKKTSSHTYQYVLDQIKKKRVQSTMFNSVLGTGIMSYTVPVDGVKEKRVLWYENIQSFGLKYDILKKAGVRGFSAWAMGQEDPRIWTLLPVKK